jgi:CubicO group peptidase (beta-lactamase class C family)
MAALNIPAVSIALIDQDRISFARAYGDGVTPDTLFQAASLSKFVAAVGAMRLVDQKRLSLDTDVNAALTSWEVPANAFDKDHPVTLRGLLSMTGGIGVPGFIGYELGVPLPTLTQILNGAPPANCPPVTVIGVPGSAYQYSGGGYEIMEALIVDTLHALFPEAMDALVLKPAEMAHSTFAQPLPPELAITATARNCPAASASVRSTLRQDCGPRPQTSLIFCCWLAAPGAGRAGCFSRRRRAGRC